MRLAQRLFLDAASLFQHVAASLKFSLQDVQRRQAWPQAAHLAMLVAQQPLANAYRLAGPEMPESNVSGLVFSPAMSPNTLIKAGWSFGSSEILRCG